MKAITLTETISAAQEAVFDYLTNIDHLPQWATEFCQELTVEGDKYKVLTPMGELYLRLVADKSTGVIDMQTSPDGINESALATRLIPLPNGETLWSVTCAKEAGLSTEVFEQQIQSLQREMGNVTSRFARLGRV